MSSSAGPKISKNGLIFSYDMKNTQKSWKGQPTINLAINPAFTDAFTSWQGSVRSASHNDTYTYVVEDGIPHMNIHWERVAGSGNSWASLRNSGRMLTTEEYTISGQYRVNASAGAGGTGELRMAAKANDYWTSGRQTTPMNSSDVGLGWQNFSMTRTYVATYTLSAVDYPLDGLFEAYTGSMPTAGDMLDWDIRFLQLELGGYKTPFVDGTRSTTTALVDLTGNAGVEIITDLDYQPDGTARYAIGSRVDLTNVPTSTSEVTISCWVKVDVHASFNRIINNAWVGNGWLLFSDGALWRFGIAQNSTQYNHSIAHLGSNDWTHLCGVYDGSNVILYVNGETSGTPPAIADATLTQGLLDIGYSSNQGPVDVDKIDIYNRALTANEVKRNFEAHRVNYGL